MKNTVILCALIFGMTLFAYQGMVVSSRRVDGTQIQATQEIQIARTRHRRTLELFQRSAAPGWGTSEKNAKRAKRKASPNKVKISPSAFVV